MLTSFPDIYKCNYCNSEEDGHSLVRCYKTGKPVWSCLECKVKYEFIRKPGWIYMIGYDEWWKVGFTTKAPEIRMKDLQCGNPNTLRLALKKFVQDCLASELFYHRKLSAFHHKGEWFHGPEADIMEILSPLHFV